MLATQDRYDLGGTSTVRYPQDKFDRIWTPSPYNHLDILRNVSSKEAISTGNATNLPPTTVMQTAWVVKSLVSFVLPESSKARNKYVAFYFAEIETLNMSESRSFNLIANGMEMFNVTLVRNYSSQQEIVGPFSNFGLVEDANSTLPPIINAYEYYWTVDTELPTFSDDSKPRPRKILISKLLILWISNLLMRILVVLIIWLRMLLYSLPQVELQNIKFI